MSKCPICNSSKTEKKYIISSSFASSIICSKHSIKEISIDVQNYIETLWGSSMAIMFQCEDCLLKFYHPFIAGDEYFYNLSYSSENHYYPDWKWEYQVTLDSLNAINKISFEEDHFLEIGAGEGKFIKRISPLLFKRKNVYCTEYSDFSVKSLQLLEVNVINGNILSINHETFKSFFSIICMFQVLEHMDKVNKIFSILSNICRPAAHLFIAVPNHIQRDFFESRGIYLDIPPTHIGQYQYSTFIELSNRHGFEIIDYQIEPLSFIKKLKLFLALQYKQFFPKSQLIRRFHDRRIIQVMIYFFFLFRYLRTIINLPSLTLGTSQWIHLQKIS